MKALRKLAALTLSLAATPCLAGIADSPLPVLEVGKTTYHIYSVPGYIRSGGLSSFFSCTSTDTTTMRVGVEVFGSPGGAPFNDAVASSLIVVPGANVIFGTSSAVGIAIDSNVGGSTRGSARILATSKKLVCTAFVADIGNAPPTTAWQLNIIAKTKQKGD